MSDIIKYCTIFALFAFTAASIIDRPKYIECIDSLECAVGTCCTVGMGKFSIPKCQPLVERGEVCRPASELPGNADLSYPDGQTVHATNIYFVKCPCAHGLRCSNMTGFCEDPFEEFKHNFIEHGNDV